MLQPVTFTNVLSAGLPPTNERNTLYQWYLRYLESDDGICLGLTGSNYIWDIVEIYPECKKLCKTSKEFEMWSAHLYGIRGWPSRFRKTLCGEKWWYFLIVQMLHHYSQEAWNEKVLVLSFLDFWLMFPYFKILRDKMTLILKSSNDSFPRYGNPDTLFWEPWIGNLNIRQIEQNLYIILSF